MNFDIFPINITSYQLNFGNNKFYPMYNGKVMDLLCNIIKQNGIYFFKIEEVQSKEYLKNGLNLYLKTKNLEDIRFILNSYAKNHFVEFDDNLEKFNIKIPLKGEIITFEEKLKNQFSIYDKINDLNEQIIYSLDIFETFEEIYYGGPTNFLSNENVEKVYNIIELFITQYDEKVFQKLKIQKSSIIFRMISFYNQKRKGEFEKSIIEILCNLVNYLNKLPSKNIESLFTISTKLIEISSRNKNFNNLDKYLDLHEKIEIEFLKLNEKKENSILNIEKCYRELLIKNGVSLFDNPEKYGQPYTEQEMKEIISNLSDLLPSSSGEYNLSMKNAKDLISQLAFDMKRSLGGIIEIYMFCFSPNPFRSLENQYIKDDLSYTMKMLLIKKELGLDKYGKSNNWFKELYEKKLNSGLGSEKTLLRNIKMLEQMI